MKYSDYFGLVARSLPTDWNAISCWGHGAGPSYRNRFSISSYPQTNPPRWDLEVESHSMVAAFKDDLNVTIAWGLTHNDDFREDWANDFPDSHATSGYVDFFYQNSLIHRDIFVTVDGGRVSLPLPEKRDGTLVSPSFFVSVCRLLQSLEGAYADEFDRYLEDAGIEVVDEPWPRQ